METKICKSCKYEYVKEYNKDNKEKVLNYYKEYRKNNQEKSPLRLGIKIKKAR